MNLRVEAVGRLGAAILCFVKLSIDATISITVRIFIYKTISKQFYIMTNYGIYNMLLYVTLLGEKKRL